MLPLSGLHMKLLFAFLISTLTTLSLLSLSLKFHLKFTILTLSHTKKLSWKKHQCYILEKNCVLMLSVETLLIWRTLYNGNLSLTVLSFLSKKVPLQLVCQLSHSSNPDDSYFGKYGLLDFQPLYSPPPPLPYLCHQSLLHQHRLPGLDPWRVKPHGARLAVQSSRRRCLEGSPGQMPTPKLSVVSLL